MCIWVCQHRCTSEHAFAFVNVCGHVCLAYTSEVVSRIQCRWKLFRLFSLFVCFIYFFCNRCIIIFPIWKCASLWKWAICHFSHKRRNHFIETLAKDNVTATFTPLNACIWPTCGMLNNTIVKWNLYDGTMCDGESEIYPLNLRADAWYSQFD